jgi:hypothetical protein
MRTRSRDTRDDVSMSRLTLDQRRTCVNSHVDPPSASDARRELIVIHRDFDATVY